MYNLCSVIGCAGGKHGSASPANPGRQRQSAAMSVVIHTRGEAGGGVAAHLQCPHCGHLSKSHAQQLSHLAASHPTCLDGVAVGRLGNILMYQSSGRLFHCSECFYTYRDFTKLYKHIIARHCMVNRECGGGEEEQGEEEEAPEKKRTTEERDKEAPDRMKCKEEGDEAPERKRGETEEGEKDASKRKQGDEGKVKEEDGEKKAPEEHQNIEGPNRKRSNEGEEEGGPESKRNSEDAGKEEDGEKDPPKNKQSVQGEEEKERETDAPGRKGSSEDDAEEEQNTEVPAEVKTGDEEKKCVLTYDGILFHCKICGWSHKQKSVSVSHIVRKHEIPKIYASHALTRSREVQMGGVEEEDGIGLSEEMMKEEIKVTEKLVGFVSHRFVCLVCNWRSKLKGFVLTHIERHHDVERRYGCKECPQKFFLPSRLQQHVRTAHRPGRYACPFCWFRSEFLGGFRRHCSRCNAREEEGGMSGGGGGRGELEEEVEEEPEERKETRGMRRRRSLERRGEEEEQEDEDDD
ncbi:myoneurin-like [Girardinichthys multiradiatus]|uniref:myoneurin-like n=1 Tax=Girardinichthys multiradiatus TaxID=208333 RepID=UPI001FAE2B3D|nr:myoneurin-like [Girardinichthys multiradiatus]